ncbi:MAG: hypothetical protein WC843_03965 [Candidatus Gracilibacteria bacterium]|jgi:hypothetical protein
MNIPLFSIGLLLIVVSWIVQIGYMLVRDTKITWGFSLIQTIGIVLLVVDMVMNSAPRDLNFYLEIGTGLGALLTLIVSQVKK